MASSKPVNADKIMSEGVAAIHALKNLGLLDAVLERVNQPNAPASSAGGTMSDACKRRITGPEEELLIEAAIQDDYEEAMVERAIAKFNGDQSPIVPGSGSFTVVSESDGYPQGKLPPGFDSLAAWGRTICDLPKVRHLEMSYAELHSAGENGNAMIASYCEWIRTYNGTSARAIDFRKYLAAVNELSGPRNYFPGTQIVRRLK